jgi:hypothetical protein
MNKHKRITVVVSKAENYSVSTRLYFIDKAATVSANDGRHYQTVHEIRRKYLQTYWWLEMLNLTNVVVYNMYITFKVYGYRSNVIRSF